MKGLNRENCKLAIRAEGKISESGVMQIVSCITPKRIKQKLNELLACSAHGKLAVQVDQRALVVTHHLELLNDPTG